MAIRFVRSVVSFALALALVPVLPLYIERTLRRSWQVDRTGDQIDWGWRLTSLYDYWSNYNYLSREQQPALWLSLDIGLAVLYALIFALTVDQVFAWIQKEKPNKLRTG